MKHHIEFVGYRTPLLDPNCLEDDLVFQVTIPANNGMHQVNKWLIRMARCMLPSGEAEDKDFGILVEEAKEVIEQELT